MFVSAGSISTAATSPWASAAPSPSRSLYSATRVVCASGTGGADVARSRDRLAVRPEQRERLVDAAVVAPREHEDLRTAGQLPGKADRPPVGVARGQRERPARHPEAPLSSAPTQAALSVGIIAVRPPCSCTRDWIAATTGAGEWPGHRAGVAEREVDVLEAVDVGHATAAGAAQIQREVARGLVHPRHRHAAEQVALSARVGLGGAGVSAGVLGAFALEEFVRAGCGRWRSRTTGSQQRAVTASRRTT